MRTSPRDFIPPTQAGRTFVCITLVDAIGTGLFLAGSVIFFIRFVGLTSGQVGCGLAVAGAAGFLATVPIGVLVDRLGARPMLIMLQLWRAVWFVSYLFISGPVAFAALASCLAIAAHSVSPATQAVVSAAVEDGDRVRTMAIIQSVRNVGFSVGAALTAPLLAAQSRWAFQAIVLSNALSFVIAAVLLARLRLEHGLKSAADASPIRRLRGFRDWPYLRLTGLNGILTLHMTILSVAMPLWTVTATQAPTALVPLLIVINTVMAVTLQVPFSKGVDHPHSAVQALRRAAGALALCCVLMAAADGRNPVIAVVVLAAATIFLSASELWQCVGAWALSYTYAIQGRQTEYLSIISLGTNAQEIIGPALISVAVIGTGWVGWLFLAAVFVATSLLVRPTTAALARDRSAMTTQAGDTHQSPKPAPSGH